MEGMEQTNGCQQHTTLFNQVECQQLMWETLSDKELHTLESNVNLGADLIYDPLYIPHLVKFLASLLLLDHSAQTNDLDYNVHEFPVAYIASAVRNPETLIYMYFVETLRKAGLRMIVSERVHASNLLSRINGARWINNINAQVASMERLALEEYIFQFYT